MVGLKGVMCMGVVIGVSVLGGGSAHAQNLVTNGDFDQNELGWDTPTYILLDWDSSDCHGESDSGSGLFTNIAPTAYNAGGTQCVTTGIVGGAAYDFGVWHRVPSGQVSGQVEEFLRWWTEPGCSGTSTLGPSLGIFVESDEWAHRRALDIVAPQNTASVMVTLTNYKYSGGGQREAAFDGVSLGPAGHLFHDGFESGTTSAW